MLQSPTIRPGTHQTVYSPQKNQLIGFMQRRSVEVFTVLFLVYVAYSSLYPFEVSYREFAFSANRSLLGLDSPPASRLDIVANVFLFLPAGFLLQWSFKRAGASNFRAMVPTVLLGAALAYTCEWLQRFSPIRVSSYADFACNAFGTVCGAMLAVGVLQLSCGTIEKLKSELRCRPAATAPKVCALCLTLLALLPLDFRISPRRIGAAIHQAHYIPFGRLQVLEQEHDRLIAAGKVAGAYRVEYNRLMFYGRCAAETGGFILFGMLLMHLLRRHYGFGALAGCWTTWWLALMLAIPLNLVQLVVASRDVDVTFLIMNVIGAIVGTGVYESGWLPIREKGIDYAFKKAARWALVGLVAYFIYTGLVPFRFSPDSAFVAQQTTKADVIPLERYFEARWPTAAADMISKITVFALIGAVLSSVWGRLRSGPNRQRIGYLLTFSVLVAVPVELAQFFLPLRTPSVTAVLLAMTGALAGYLTYQWAVAYYRRARSSGNDLQTAPADHATSTAPPMPPYAEPV